MPASNPCQDRFTPWNDSINAAWGHTLTLIHRTHKHHAFLIQRTRLFCYTKNFIILAFSTIWRGKVSRRETIHHVVCWSGGCVVMLVIEIFWPFSVFKPSHFNSKAFELYQNLARESSAKFLDLKLLSAPVWDFFWLLGTNMRQHQPRTAIPSHHQQNIIRPRFLESLKALQSHITFCRCAL